ncbi:disease resistance protein RUN1-like [Rosa sericea]
MNSLASQFGASSSSSSTHSWTYDVFLSFRGKDTRYNFTDHLHSNLVQKGIKTFIDDELTRGEEISPALLKAIEESRISIIVFSANYAASKWCLDELVHILECRRSKKQMVRPIFYKVDPSNVRNQRGSFGDALANHESNFKGNRERIARWRAALSQAANLSGWTFLEGYEAKFIHKIVDDISAQVLKHTDLNVAKYPVGIESRVEDVLKLLDVQESNVRMVGIWGIGGIGKTTIAKAVYNLIAHKFECSCFLTNVRERSLSYKGLVNLQNILLSKIPGANGLISVTNTDIGISVIKKRFSQKRVLLILDDVNHIDQLNTLAGESSWFGSHSRIIITTRDKHFLSGHLIYQVKELNYEESLELFNFHAFRGDRRVEQCSKLADKITLYARGLPLALVVLGSHLSSISKDHWQEPLNSYISTVPNQEIQEILKISYDALGDLTKEIFLHIACFFKGRNKNDVIAILESCDLCPKYGIEVLIEKAFIYITEANDIWMHDRLEEMGKEIVRQESPTEPGKRSRLWSYEDIYHVFEENTGTNKVKGIMVKNCGSEHICLRGESFSKLKNLQLLMIYEDIFHGDHVDYISKELRFFEWKKCPLRSFPSIDPKKLVLLKMDWSYTSLGEGLKMQNLISMDLSWCGLTKIPNLSGLPNLVDLILKWCLNLVEVHPSVGFLDKLVKLDLEGCQFLTVLPGRINLKSLETLSLQYCHRLENFPEILGEMKSLKCLDLAETAINALPSSIRYLINLERLNLRACGNLTDVPCSIFELQHLQCLDLQYCQKLVTFPSKSESLPSLTSTKSMNLYNCQRLCDNVPRDMAKMKTNLVKDDDQVSTLLSLCLSCQKSEFQVVFSGSQVPKWFSCRKDFSDPDYTFTCKFCIELPQNFKWENKGLALCIAAETSLDVTRIIRAIHINEKLIYRNPNSEDVPVLLQMSAHVWVYYITFLTIIRRLSESGSPPPYMCRIRFEFEYYDVVGSCGVHVVMPQHEDVSMELLVHEVDDEHSSFSDEDFEDEELIPEDEDLRNAYLSQNDDHHHQKAMNPRKRKVNWVEPNSCQ